MSLLWHNNNNQVQDTCRPYEMALTVWERNKHVATYVDMVDVSNIYSIYVSSDTGYVLARNTAHMYPTPVCLMSSMTELMQVLPTFLYAQHSKATFFEVPKLRESQCRIFLDFRHMQVYYQAHNVSGQCLDHSGFYTSEAKAWVTPHKSYLTALISTLKHPENYFITPHHFEEGMLPIKLAPPTYIPEMNDINAPWAVSVT